MPAQVQRLAPTFKAEMVENGVFGEVDLEKLKGKWYVLTCFLGGFLSFFLLPFLLVVPPFRAVFKLFFFLLLVFE
jgi:hypothetical protein